MTVIRWNEKNLGGQGYPALAGLTWRIVTTKYSDKTLPGLLNPDKDIALRWVKDSHVSDLYVDGYTWDSFAAYLKLQMSNKKGGFVRSKRVSRIMSAFFYWENPIELDVYYDPTMDKKLWDGMMLIDESVLPKLCNHLPEARKEELTKKLLECGRVEITLVSEHGEDKGHAMVMKDLGHDIIAPLDTKTEIKTGAMMLAVRPVHSRDWMYIDPQSLINLYPFLREEHYLPWLMKESERALKDLTNGKWARMAVRLPPKMRENFWIMEYLAKGYDPRWFQGTIKSLGSIHHIKVWARAMDKMKLPIPGARYYVAVDKTVGRRLKKGVIALDPKRATCLVSRYDWDRLSAIWGGADQDDALWLLPFTDWDGVKKILCWRSPNQMGEYALLLPHGKFPKTWTWDALDSRDLPAKVTHKYLGLIPEASDITPDTDIQSLMRDIQAAFMNKGAVGMMVNFQMVYKSMTGTLMEELPATLEDILDGAVKNGASLEQVKGWIRAAANKFFFYHPQVPRSLVKRISRLLDDEVLELLEPTDDHWIEHLRRSVETHLAWYDLKVQEIANTCTPPVSVLMYGDDFIVEAGVVENAYLQARDVISKSKSEEDWNTLKRATLEALKQFPVENWTKIMSAIACRSYVMSDRMKSSDAILWQSGIQPGIMKETGWVKTGKRLRGFCNITMAMLDEVNPQPEPLHETICVKGLWFSKYNDWRKSKGLVPVKGMSDIPKVQRDQFKALINKWAKEGKYDAVTLNTKVEGDRVAVYRDGTMIGYVQKGQEDRVGKAFQPVFTLSYDGNMYAVVKEVFDGSITEAADEGAGEGRPGAGTPF